MKWLEKLLDRHTMYRVVLTVLGVWVAASFLLSVLQVIPFTPLELLSSFAILLLVSFTVHYLFKFVFRAPANLDSTLITALILFFLFLPTTVPMELAGIALAATVGVVGKYLLAYHKLHLFNPAAMAAFAVGLTQLNFAAWWVANPYLFPLVLLGGLIIAKKIRHLTMVYYGLAAAFLVFVLVKALHGPISFSDLQFFFVSTPIIFFLTVMVTEPLSTPGTHKLQSLYGMTAGALSSLPFAFGPFLVNTPELSLLIANLLFYPTTLRGRLVMSLEAVKEVAKNTFEYSFKTSTKFKFKPGQYLEWTLPHRGSDQRGIRRYFTIASAPSEETVKLTVRTTDSGSSFKKELQALKPGDKLYATSRAGDFVLPPDSEKYKYIFIAGGIGVTPFRSIIKEMMAQGRNLDAVLFYANKTAEDIAYGDLFREAKKIGLEFVPLLDNPPEIWDGEKGFIDDVILRHHASDFKERITYISGPPPMVNAYKKLLLSLGVKREQIKTDYFPGLA